MTVLETVNQSILTILYTILLLFPSWSPPSRKKTEREIPPLCTVKMHSNPRLHAMFVATAALKAGCFQIEKKKKRRKMKKLTHAIVVLQRVSHQRIAQRPFTPGVIMKKDQIKERGYVDAEMPPQGHERENNKTRQVACLVWLSQGRYPKPD